MGDPVTLTLGFTIASSAMQGVGKIVEGVGQSKGYLHKKTQMLLQAEEARTQAAQTNAYMLDELDRTLGNINAVRASTGADVTSATSMALREQAITTSTRERKIRVANLNAKAAQASADAAFYKNAARSSIFSGFINAAPFLLSAGSGLSKFSSLGGAGASGGSAAP